VVMRAVRLPPLLLLLLLLVLLLVAGTGVYSPVGVYAQQDQVRGERTTGGENVRGNDAGSLLVCPRRRVFGDCPSYEADEIENACVRRG